MSNVIIQIVSTGNVTFASLYKEREISYHLASYAAGKLNYREITTTTTTTT